MHLGRVVESLVWAIRVDPLRSMPSVAILIRGEKLGDSELRPYGSLARMKLWSVTTHCSGSVMTTAGSPW
jgi:hypothetical protein